MSRLTTLIFVFMGIITLSYFGGLIDSSGNDLLVLALDPQNISVQDIIQDNLIQVLALLGTVAAITVGVFVAGNLDFVVLGGVALFLQTLLFSITEIVSVVMTVNEPIAILITSPLIVYTVIASIEWWGNRS